MRRTYRSKKETSGALDHKDVIQTLDEKSSAFDAFYIQNIKQTKREMSCIGSSHQYGPAANKVRKRKYVKRIIKDPEPSIANSSSHSVFLTPDKSIRVNKPQDLFDQLLNSFSPQQRDSPMGQSRQSNGPLASRQAGKTYTRRKLAKIKKLNCSSSDSIESDKENSNVNCEAHNTTDLHSYELLIEKEKKASPKYLDESINKIVKNMPLLNNVDYEKSSVGSAKKVYNNLMHRLTTTAQSPSNSPSCSTPFKERYRGQSIYKFSPITFGKKDNNTSADYLTVVEENGKDESVVFIDKNQDDSIKLSGSEDNAPSPIIHLTKNKKSSNKTASPNLETQFLSIHETVQEHCDKSNSKSNEISTIEISDLQTTEAEPFLGFECVPPNVCYPIDHIIKQLSPNNNNSSENLKYDNVHDISANENLSYSEIDPELDSVDEQSEEENVTENKSCQEMNTSNSLPDIAQEEFENESSYDTCNSEQFSLSDNNLEENKVPVVNIERLSNSVLQKYLQKIDSDTSNELDSDDYASFEVTNSSHNDSDKSLSKECDLEENTLEKVSFDSSDSNCNDEEERCISFVTTRRRNEMTNDSLIFSFNNSFGSASSSDCDKTVLSNKYIFDEKSNLSTSVEAKNNYNENTDSNNDEISSVTSEECDSSEKDINNGNSNRVSLRNVMDNQKTLTDSMFDDSIRKSMIDEGKPAIVLQPGKKWERSLSIYRRMTMLTDSFDKTILDNDDLHTKGRKYRQSVISTMELQDKGSLHNESIISRRSTFVSKPCRSTIRIIKEPNSSRLSLCTTAVADDLRGFLNEDCDDTIIELSKLSIVDSDHEVTVIENFHDTSNRVSTARDYVLRRCNQTDAIHFDECYPETVLKNCRKIGEGVYGEVFLWRAGDGRARVMKIVPIAGTTKVNGERQKDFHEIISEIVIAMELSALRAPIDEIQREFDEGKSIDALDLHSVENATDVFNEVVAVRCVYGAYPSRLLDLWELYDECSGSDNDNPAVLPRDQQFVVLELANAGRDLESYEFNSAEQAHALFLQVAFGLAVGEEAFQFEHRDLHWGNVLIAPTDQKYATFVLRGRPHRVSRCGVAATIIDYSLSRLSLPLAGAGDAAALYNDLAGDDGLFDAVGDYQFQVYRLMRDKLGNDWKNFEPYTNILWLHYTVDKMITALRYKRTNTKIHKHYIAKLKGIKNRILEYGSAAQFVLTDNEL